MPNPSHDKHPDVENQGLETSAILWGQGTRTNLLDDKAAHAVGNEYNRRL